MEKIALVTDSSSTLTVKTAKDFGAYLVCNPIIIGEETYFEDVSITYDQFVDILKSKQLPKTSQPSVGEAEELFEELLKTYDKIVAVVIHRFLSSTYDTFSALAEKYQGRVFVADLRAASGNQLYYLKKVRSLIDEGKSFEDIKTFLNSHTESSSVYLVPNDISYLRRTGRTSATKAFIAGLLGLFPILHLGGEGNFKPVTNVRGFRKALIESVKFHLNNGVTSKTHMFVIMQIDNLEYASIAKAELIKTFGEDSEIEIHTITPVIACHTGLKTVAICANKKV